MANALRSKLLTASGQARTAPSGPPSAKGAPMKGRVCNRMMITPMPDMNPDMTE